MRPDTQYSRPQRVPFSITFQKTGNFAAVKCRQFSVLGFIRRSRTGFHTATHSHYRTLPFLSLKLPNRNGRTGRVCYTMAGGPGVAVRRLKPGWEARCTWTEIAEYFSAPQYWC